MAGWDERFDDYVGRLGDVLGHADRRAPLRASATGLLLPGERKNVEPMAARVEPARVGAAPRRGAAPAFVAAARTISRSSRCRSPKPPRQVEPDARTDMNPPGGGA